MKNQWTVFLFGKVTVKVTGKGIERLLNVLIRNEIHIWNVKRHGTDTITFKIKLSDALKIRHFVRKSGCRISFLGKSGAPFLLMRLLKNSGFLIGAVFFVVIVFLLSNVIWGIEVKGAKPATEYQIRQELDKMGVKIGKFQFFVDNAEGIQRRLTDNVGELTWVGVELKGTTYHLQVVEKNEPKQPVKLTPRNLIAKKKAVIVRMDIDDGQKVVDVNDYVERGQLLVSGQIGQEGKEPELVAAKGDVWGETWYKGHVELPIKSTFFVYNGKEKRKYSLLLGSFEIPVWGFGKHEFKDYKMEKNIHKLHFLKWKLPISYVDKTIREQEKFIRTYTDQEAEEKAIELAKNDIKKKVDEDAIFKDEKILHKVIKNGKVILDIHFKIIENIAIGQPITKEIHE
ncbi:sporulation protein YqfD [Neobacillus kokaensis]|uniref:Stage IV sporulation protein n=1 Tax=Neobacillus kokaensis TaxID=2759023 RepID=A0ABQ3N066_9BACI|nr:sporulation protein YqfD [Neobacillus kokaensis]GHH97042.1 hypothetical protein AM1BK_05850 [Neobacillus kokaensis]